MYRNKRDVDKHVESLISKLSLKEFKTRSYSIARLYFDVGDFSSCVKYVEEYLTSKNNNAAAYKLLGQAFQKLGQKEKALEQFKTSLDLDPTQTSTILDICELLADDEIAIDPGRARYCYTVPQNYPEQTKTDNIKPECQTVDEANLPNSPLGETFKEKMESIISGEDNEELIFGQMAKLYKYISGKWEKQAVGIVKVLKQKENERYRILMRQEKDFSVCLNYPVTSEMKCKPKDGNTWHLTVNDYSEGESCVENFCLKFPNTEQAIKFKSNLDKVSNLPTESLNDKREDDTDDVVFVAEILASNEEQQKAIELKLPENFYTYRNKPPCQGCRGCKDDEDNISEAHINATLLANSESTVKPPETNISTPLKTSIKSVQSPSSSMYGTPGNFNETADCSYFCTPLGSQGYNSKSPFLSNNKNDSNSADKENTLTEKSNMFTDFSGQKLKFGTTSSQSSIFSPQPSTIIKKPILAAPKLDSLNTNISGETKSNENKTMFTVPGVSSNKSIFDFSSNKKSDIPQVSDIKSVFGDNQNPVNLFSGASQGSIFGPSALKGDSTNLTGLSSGSKEKSFESKSTILGKGSYEIVSESSKLFGKNPSESVVLPGSKDDASRISEKEKVDIPLKVDNALSFAALSTSGPGFNKKADFKWEGAGQQLFTAKSNKPMDEKLKDVSASEEAETGGGAEEEYDPHFEPIVPLPEKIVVTTGEEDEEKLFGERCKLFRYVEKTREWKERGVGEIKILYHPIRMTYRLLLRRELVHKAVLNMLLFIDLELLPMKNSDRAWTWAGINYAENTAGEQETLAVRFKTAVLAASFHDKVVECVRKLQVAAAEVIRNEKKMSEIKFESVAPLRLPKHLEDSARADEAISAKVAEQQIVTGITDEKEKTVDFEPKDTNDTETKQVHFEETEEVDTRENDEDENQYDLDYHYNEEEEEESGVYFSCEGEAVVAVGIEKATCPQAHIQVVFDQDIYSPKITVTDSNTGEVLADMLIYTDTEFHINGDSCSWSGQDYDASNKAVTINFSDSETAMYFYDSCETSKSATYASTDPES
ncbi:unnamed protein product, partial [Iphiclides podalirius]